MKHDLFCYLCGKDFPNEDEVLVGQNEAGEYLSGHVACLVKEGLDVCGDCMKIVPASKIVDPKLHICKACHEKADKEKIMKVYFCKGFTGFWPTGTSAVIVAENPEDGAKLLERQLDEIGLGQRIDPESMKELDLTKVGATVLNDGNY